MRINPLLHRGIAVVVIALLLALAFAPSIKADIENPTRGVKQLLKKIDIHLPMSMIKEKITPLLNRIVTRLKQVIPTYGHPSERLTLDNLDKTTNPDGPYYFLPRHILLHFIITSWIISRHIRLAFWESLGYDENSTLYAYIYLLNIYTTLFMSILLIPLLYAPVWWIIYEFGGMMEVIKQPIDFVIFLLGDWAFFTINLWLYLFVEGFFSESGLRNIRNEMKE